MTERLLKVLPLGVFGALIAVLTAGFSPAQEPIPLTPPGAQPAQPVPVPRLPGGDPDPIPLPIPGQPVQPGAQPAQPAEPEVLAKGPMHEAFATTAEAPTASPIVKKQPPDPIEELPPEQKPAGDNVQWIPGYWGWDEDGERFIWVSGFWRQPPPGRVWVPGSWREAKGGWQWVSGFWQVVAPQGMPGQPQQPAQPEIEYLPEPPATVESGPTVVAPNTTSFYVPGSWVWRGNRYAWRPGVWVEYRSGWVWVPARYHWTPAGYVFVEGYWDYPIATRGVLFAPVVFVGPPRPRTYVYTPVYVVSEPAIVGALFVRRGHAHYYFGDYYDGVYIDRGYSAWCGTYSRTGFTVGFGVGRSWGYDPLWSYYSVTYRSVPAWNRGVGDLYHGRYRGELMRPPTTLVQQNTTINHITKTNVTNVTNNITVVNGAPVVNNTNVSNVAMVAPLKVAPDLTRTKFETVSADNRRTEAAAARQIREVATQRTKLETAAAQQPVVQPTPGQPAVTAQPRSIKLDVPKTAVARSQVREEKLAPPPPAHKPTAATTPTTPTTPGPGVKLDPPKIDPKPPIGTPTVPTTPKVDPKPPIGTPTVPTTPKIEPKPPIGTPTVPTVPKLDPPKVDPKPPVNPVPKFDPPKTDPKQPVVPKFDPKLPPAKIDPPRKSDPPRGNPPREQPKGESPRPPVSLGTPVQPKPIVVVPPVQPSRPVVTAPPVQPKPIAVAPPVQPRAPTVTPPAQPRPTVTAPSAPPRATPPAKPQPPAEKPKAKPAPPGKPPAKTRKGRDDDD